MVWRLGIWESINSLTINSAGISLKARFFHNMKNLRKRAKYSNEGFERNLEKTGGQNSDARKFCYNFRIDFCICLGEKIFSSIFCWTDILDWNFVRKIVFLFEQCITEYKKYSFEILGRWGNWFNNNIQSCLRSARNIWERYCL